MNDLIIKSWAQAATLLHALHVAYWDRTFCKFSAVLVESKSRAQQVVLLY